MFSNINNVLRVVDTVLKREKVNADFRRGKDMKKTVLSYGAQEQRIGKLNGFNGRKKKSFEVENKNE